MATGSGINNNKRSWSELNQTMSENEMSVEDAMVSETDIEAFESMIEPTSKDLMKLLAKNTRTNNFIVCQVASLEGRISSIETKQVAITTRLDNNEDRLSKVETSQSNFQTSTNEKFASVEEGLRQLYGLIQGNTSSNNLKDQRELDKDVILKGFAQKPDATVVTKNFASMYNIDLSSINESYYFSYNLPARGQGDITKTLHFVVICFKKKATKVEMFITKKAKGSPTWSQLEPEALNQAAQSTDIIVTNKLTKFNLAVQKALYGLKNKEVIFDYRFHNNLYQVKDTPTSAWTRIVTWDELNKRIPKKTA